MKFKELVEKLAMHGLLAEGVTVENAIKEYEKLDEVEQGLVYTVAMVMLDGRENELNDVVSQITEEVTTESRSHADIMAELFMNSVERLNTIHCLNVMENNIIECTFFKQDGTLLFFASIDYDNNVHSFHGVDSVEVVTDDVVIYSMMVEMLEKEYAK